MSFKLFSHKHIDNIKRPEEVLFPMPSLPEAILVLKLAITNWQQGVIG